MLYPKMQANRVTNKDITAFYGVNRTAQINDFQLSDMVNMDCESFPYVKTRGARERFPNADFRLMSFICSDTDVYDDYLVTGVDDSGKFIYRGNEKKIIHVDNPDEYLASGFLLSNSFMTEFLGDYVFLPSMNVVYSDSDGEYWCDSFQKNGDATKYDIDVWEYQRNSYPSVNADGSISIAICGNGAVNNAFYKINGTLFYYIKTGVIAPGKCYKLKLTCKYGKYEVVDVNRKIYEEKLKKSIVCPIPDDIFMVVSKIKLCKQNYSEEIDFDPADIEASLNGDDDTSYRVDIEAQAYNSNGEKVSISEYFYESVLNPVNKSYFSVENFGGSSSARYWNQLEFIPVNPPSQIAESYGGRLFLSDIYGVDIFYTSASGIKNTLEQSKRIFNYDGFVSCSDAGRWTALCSYNNFLYAFKRDSMYRIYSQDGLSFYLERIADVGALSNSSVCVVNNVMYFLSVEGLFAYSGSFPSKLSDSLGRNYIGGVLEGNDDKLFCSLKYKDGNDEKNELCVYHIDKGIFSIHDSFDVKSFIKFGGEIFALENSGEVYRMDRERCGVSFSLDTKHYFFSFQKKAVNSARLYFDYEPSCDDDYFEVLISRDGGEFEPALPKIKNGKVKYVPIKFCKCDEFCIRIRGSGVFTLKGLSFSLYQGGDVKQN